MEVNGIAHIFLTASNYQRSRDFYSRLLPFLGLKPVIDTETTYYCLLRRRPDRGRHQRAVSRA
jgi:catechol 2,3-dioxygenase-like lactoylglutathione lyase family enzyme